MFRAILTGTLLALAVAGANAAEVEVKMLNKGTAGVMVFEPAFVKIAPGDSVKFVAADKGHNAESVPEILPTGAQPFVGKLSEDVTVTFAEAGAYGVRCKPHYGMGMVALVVVGEPANLDAAQAGKYPGKARQVFADLLGQAKAQLAQAK
jgi:pseudoazurin